jgi:hypothetical protein
VGEAAGTATDLSTTTRRTSCVDKAHTAKPADTDGSLAVAKGDQWECVITNTRKSTPTRRRRRAADHRRPVAPPAVSRDPQVRVSPRACARAARS